MQFALLEHRCESEKHWDLLLEWPGEEQLRTWQFSELPWESTRPGKRTFDHRRIYLHYEGPLSNGRGMVRQCLSGTYQLVHETEEGCWVALDGNTEILLWLCYKTEFP